MPITATGLGSGLDVETLVAQLVLADVQPAEQRLNSEEAGFQAELSAYGIVSNELASFQSSIAAAANLGNYTAYSSISDDETVDAVAGSAAEAATYNIEVTALAGKQVLASSSASEFSATSDVVGEGTLTIQSLAGGAEPVVITIDSSNSTLAGIRDAINTAAAAVTASIINDGSGYRLVLTASDTGLENRVDITVSETSDDGDQGAGLSQMAYSSTNGSGNLTQVQVAQDAAFSIDGLDITSPSNTISSAVEGLTFSLNGVTSRPVEITVSKNKSLAIAAVNGFVNAFNSLNESLSGLTAYNSELESGSTLTGDATVRTILSGVRNLINTAIPYVDGNYATLAELGITTNVLTGSLEVDASALDLAVSSNALDVANVFARVGRSGDSNLEFIRSSDQTVAGEYAVDFSQTNTAGSLVANAITTTGNYGNQQITFTINVDGQAVNVDLDTENTLEVPSSSSNPSLEEVRTAIENAINSQLSSGRSLSVATDGTPAFVFTSGSTGTSSSIEITAESSSSDRFGLVVSAGIDGTSTTTATINGEAASYDAETNQITGADDTAVEGLTLAVTGGSTEISTTLKYGVGIASLLQDLVVTYQGADGLIDARTEGINSTIKDITDQREALSLRASKLEARYRSQFNGLEQLIAQFTATQNFLSQALSNFVEPFSAVKK